MAKINIRQVCVRIYKIIFLFGYNSTYQKRPDFRFLISKIPEFKKYFIYLIVLVVLHIYNGCDKLQRKKVATFPVLECRQKGDDFSVEKVVWIIEIS